jgi:hypothetical protein
MLIELVLFGILFVIFANPKTYQVIGLKKLVSDGRIIGNYLPIISLVFGVVLLLLVHYTNKCILGNRIMREGFIDSTDMNANNPFVTMKVMEAPFSDMGGEMCDHLPEGGIMGLVKKETYVPPVDLLTRSLPVDEENQEIKDNPEFVQPCGANIPMGYTTWQQMWKVGCM